MGHAMAPLKDDARFLAWLHGLEDPVRGALIGGLLTLVIQSSSATVAMAITMAGKGLMSLPAGIAVMLGAELGTCSDTLLATVRTNRAALFVGLFHLLFNLATIIIGLLLIVPFTHLVEWMAGGAGVARSIANAHMLFNVLGVLLMLPFTRQVAGALERFLGVGRIATRPVMEEVGT
jgi:phosphate:Na+ symporter